MFCRQYQRLHADYWFTEWDSLGPSILISFPGDYYADKHLKSTVYDNASEQKHDLLLTVIAL